MDVINNFEKVKTAVEKLKSAGIFVSIFIDPDLEQIEAAKGAGAQQIELCTAEYAELTLSARAAHGEGMQKAESEVERIKNAAKKAKESGLDRRRRTRFDLQKHRRTRRNSGNHGIQYRSQHNFALGFYVGLYRAVEEMIEKISNYIKFYQLL